MIKIKSLSVLAAVLMLTMPAMAQDQGNMPAPPTGAPTQQSSDFHQNRGDEMKPDDGKGGPDGDFRQRREERREEWEKRMEERREHRREERRDDRRNDRMDDHPGQNDFHGDRPGPTPIAAPANK